MPTIPSKERLAAPAAVLACLCLFSAVPAGAVSSRVWKQREKADFDQGDPDGVSLTAEGPIRLGSLLESIYEPDLPFLWAVAADNHGGPIYAAGGNEGVVYRVQGKGRASGFLQVDEPEVVALAVDGTGAIYAGTAPGGSVYKFASDGTRAWKCDTGERYVWGLAVDPRGGVFAATGTSGRLVHVDAQGKPRVVFDSAETHLRVLARDAKGDLLAGSGGHGLIFRIDAEGRGTVFYDGPLSEVAAIAVGNDGTIYASFTGESGHVRASSAPGRPPGGASSSGPEGEPASPAPAAGGDSGASGPPGEQRVSLGLEGKVLAISPDGYAREIWSSGQEAILSLAIESDGTLLMGSSSQGRLYAVDRQGTVGEIARSGSSQVTALLRRGGGGKAVAEEVVVAGSNLGSVSVLRSGYGDKGTFQSKVLDAQSFATWGRLSWRADTPAGTSVAFEVRSGNTETPDRTWSPWGAPLKEAGGAPIDCPSARFLQWRATLATNDPRRSPELREVDVVYMQRNLPPEFRKMEILPPGASLQEVPAAAGQGGDPKPGDADAATHHRPKPGSRRTFEPGARSVTWQVSDPNDDDLIYDVQFRAQDETTWKTIRTRIDEDFVTFDGSTLPDGTYLVRVIASDAPSNPAGQALTAEKISQPFDVDNTPPRIEHLKAEAGKGGLQVTFTASDGFSVLREASCSLDAGEWVLARPVDGLSDSSSEAYTLTLPAPAPGEHSIVVRAMDSAGNVGSGRTVLTVP